MDFLQLSKDILIPLLGAVGPILAVIVDYLLHKDTHKKTGNRGGPRAMLCLLVIIGTANLYLTWSGHTEVPPATEPSTSCTTPMQPPQDSHNDRDPLPEVSAPQAPAVYLPGSVVQFGSYEQDGNALNGMEAINWIVLKQEGDKILLISAKGLDSLPYHQGSGSSDWKGCTLRQWLNGTFFLSAFSEAEQQQILETTVIQHKNDNDPNCEQGENTSDHVFLLSAAEYLEYMYNNGNIATEQRYGIPTEYTAAKKIDKYGIDEYCWWWLRTSAVKQENACSVTAYGSTDYGYHEIKAQTGIIRPAIWIRVN